MLIKRQVLNFILMIGLLETLNIFANARFLPQTREYENKEKFEFTRSKRNTPSLGANGPELYTLPRPIQSIFNTPERPQPIPTPTTTPPPSTTAPTTATIQSKLPLMNDVEYDLRLRQLMEELVLGGQTHEAMTPEINLQPQQATQTKAEIKLNSTNNNNQPSFTTTNNRPPNQQNNSSSSSPSSSLTNSVLDYVLLEFIMKNQHNLTQFSFDNSNSSKLSLNDVQTIQQQLEFLQKNAEKFKKFQQVQERGKNSTTPAGPDSLWQMEEFEGNSLNFTTNKLLLTTLVTNVTESQEIKPKYKTNFKGNSKISNLNSVVDDSTLSNESVTKINNITQNNYPAPISLAEFIKKLNANDTKQMSSNVLEKDLTLFGGSTSMNVKESQTELGLNDKSNTKPNTERFEEPQIQEALFDGNTSLSPKESQTDLRLSDKTYAKPNTERFEDLQTEESLFDGNTSTNAKESQKLRQNQTELGLNDSNYIKSNTERFEEPQIREALFDGNTSLNPKESQTELGLNDLSYTKPNTERFEDPQREEALFDGNTSMNAKESQQLRQNQTELDLNASSYFKPNTEVFEEPQKAEVAVALKNVTKEHINSTQSEEIKMKTSADLNSLANLIQNSSDYLRDDGAQNPAANLITFEPSASNMPETTLNPEGILTAITPKATLDWEFLETEPLVTTKLSNLTSIATAAGTYDVKNNNSNDDQNASKETQVNADHEYLLTNKNEGLNQTFLQDTSGAFTVLQTIQANTYSNHSNDREVLLSITGGHSFDQTTRLPTTTESVQETVEFTDFNTHLFTEVVTPQAVTEVFMDAATSQPSNPIEEFKQKEIRVTTEYLPKENSTENMYSGAIAIDLNDTSVKPSSKSANLTEAIEAEEFDVESTTNSNAYQTITLPSEAETIEVFDEITNSYTKLLLDVTTSQPSIPIKEFETSTLSEYEENEIILTTENPPRENISELNNSSIKSFTKSAHQTQAIKNEEIGIELPTNLNETQTTTEVFRDVYANSLRAEVTSQPLPSIEELESSTKNDFEQTELPFTTEYPRKDSSLEDVYETTAKMESNNSLNKPFIEVPRLTDTTEAEETTADSNAFQTSALTSEAENVQENVRNYVFEDKGFSTENTVELQSNMTFDLDLNEIKETTESYLVDPTTTTIATDLFDTTEWLKENAVETQSVVPSTATEFWSGDTTEIIENSFETLTEGPAQSSYEGNQKLNSSQAMKSFEKEDIIPYHAASNANIMSYHLADKNVDFQNINASESFNKNANIAGKIFPEVATTLSLTAAEPASANLEEIYSTAHVLTLATSKENASLVDALSLTFVNVGVSDNEMLSINDNEGDMTADATNAEEFVPHANITEEITTDTATKKESSTGDSVADESTTYSTITEEITRYSTITEESTTDSTITGKPTTDNTIAEEIASTTAITDENTTDYTITEEITADDTITEESSNNVSISEKFNTNASITQKITADSAITGEITPDVASTEKIITNITIIEGVSTDIATTEEITPDTTIAAERNSGYNITAESSTDDSITEQSAIDSTITIESTTEYTITEDITDENTHDSTITAEKTADDTIKEKSSNDVSIREEFTTNDSITEEITPDPAIIGEISTGLSNTAEATTDFNITEESNSDEDITEEITTSRTSTEEISSDNTIPAEISIGLPITAETTTDASIIEENNSDEAITEEITSDGTSTEEIFSDNTITEEISTGLSITAEATTDFNITEESNSDEAITEEITTSRTSTEEISSDNTITEEIPPGLLITAETTTDASITETSNSDEVITEDITTDGTSTEEISTENTITEEIPTDLSITAETATVTKENRGDAISTGLSITAETATDVSVTEESNSDDAEEVTTDLSITREIATDASITEDYTSEDTITEKITIDLATNKSIEDIDVEINTELIRDYNDSSSSNHNTPALENSVEVPITTESLKSIEDDTTATGTDSLVTIGPTLSNLNLRIETNSIKETKENSNMIPPGNVIANGGNTGSQIENGNNFINSSEDKLSNLGAENSKTNEYKNKNEKIKENELLKLTNVDDYSPKNSFGNTFLNLEPVVEVTNHQSEKPNLNYTADTKEMPDAVKNPEQNITFEKNSNRNSTENNMPSSQDERYQTETDKKIEADDDIRTVTEIVWLTQSSSIKKPAIIIDNVAYAANVNRPLSKLNKDSAKPAKPVNILKPADNADNLSELIAIIGNSLHKSQATIDKDVNTKKQDKTENDKPNDKNYKLKMIGEEVTATVNCHTATMAFTVTGADEEIQTQDDDKGLTEENDNKAVEENVQKWPAFISNQQNNDSLTESGNVIMYQTANTDNTNDKHAAVAAAAGGGEVNDDDDEGNAATSKTNNKRVTAEVNLNEENEENTKTGDNVETVETDNNDAGSTIQENKNWQAIQTEEGINEMSTTIENKWTDISQNKSNAITATPILYKKLEMLNKNAKTNEGNSNSNSNEDDQIHEDTEELNSDRNNQSFPDMTLQHHHPQQHQQHLMPNLYRKPTLDPSNNNNNKTLVLSDQTKEEITATNWWHSLPYTEIRKFLNSIFDSVPAIPAAAADVDDFIFNETLDGITATAKPRAPGSITKNGNNSNKMKTIKGRKSKREHWPTWTLNNIWSTLL